MTSDAEWKVIEDRLDAAGNAMTECQAFMQKLKEAIDLADREIGQLDADFRARLRTPPATD